MWGLGDTVRLILYGRKCSLCVYRWGEYNLLYWFDELQLEYLLKHTLHKMSRFVVSFLVDSIVYIFLRFPNNANYSFSLFLQVITPLFIILHEYTLGPYVDDVGLARRGMLFAINFKQCV